MKILAFPVVVICKLLNPVFCFEPCTLNVDVITVSGTDRADGIVEESIYFCSLRFSGCMTSGVLPDFLVGDIACVNRLIRGLALCYVLLLPPSQGIKCLDI